MTTWFNLASDSEIDRLEAAWSDAPVDNLEVCGFIAHTAHLQVAEYAGYVPVPVPTVEPVTVTYNSASPGGDPTSSGTYTFTRVGDVVTVFANMTGNPNGNANRAYVPAGWAPADSTFGLSTGKWVLTKSGDGFQAGAGSGVVPPLAYIAAPLIDPPTAEDVPFNLVFAQLQQMQNLWNAGRAQQGGEIGSDTYSFIPRPLDKNIRQIIRPQTGVPNVF